MLGLQVSPKNVNRTTLLTSASMQHSASATRTGAEYFRRVPYFRLTGPTTVSGGTTDHFHADLYEVPRRAQNSLLLTAVPNDGETLTIGDTTYTFHPSASGLVDSYTIKTYDNIIGTMVSIYRVINNVGTIGTDFACSTNAYARNNYPSNPLIFEAVASGIAGQSVYMATTSSSITLADSHFYNYQDPSYDIVYSLDIPWDRSASMSVTGTDSLASTLDGITYAGTGYFVDTSGLVCVNASTGEDYIFSIPAATYYSTYPITSLVEVSGLIAEDLVNNKINYSRNLMVSWINMTAIQEALIFQPAASPVTTGTPTQSIYGLHDYELGQTFDYYVFVCSGLTAPQRAWPRPTDSNVVWYLAGVTSDTYTEIHVPDAPYVGVWVGLIDKRDGIVNVFAPYYVTHSGIYLL